MTTMDVSSVWHVQVMTCTSQASCTVTDVACMLDELTSALLVPTQLLHAMQLPDKCTEDVKILPYECMYTITKPSLGFNFVTPGCLEGISHERTYFRLQIYPPGCRAPVPVYVP